MITNPYFYRLNNIDLASEMTNKGLKRGFLMIAGILSVAVIVLTQSFYQPTESSYSQAATKQTPEQTNNDVIIVAPSDMVPHGNTVEVSENSSSIAEKINSSNKPESTSIVVKHVFVTFFKTLFRVLIASNAP